MKTSIHRITRNVQLVIFLLSVLFLSSFVNASPSASQSAVPAATKQKLAKVQVPFIANQGQSDREVKFYARTFAGTVSVTETGTLVYSFPKIENKKQVAGATVKEELVGGKVTEITGESPAVTKLSYFKGNDKANWQSNIPNYDVVSFGEVYDGIDVKLKAYGNNVEKLFYVKPGAEPDLIKLKLSGGQAVKVNDSGELEVETRHGPITFSKPVAFQYDGAERQFVTAAYVVRGNEYGFEVGNYDRTKELVIDPILAATFLGGSSADDIRALALDSTGNLYVTGGTDSPDFPGVDTGSADSSFSDLFRDPRSGEAFVAKLNPDLSVILAATFLGGSQGDIPEALALDSSGDVYIAGSTSSPDFPGVGSESANNMFAAGGGNHGFIAKLNSDLRLILAATFLGGSVQDDISALAVDVKGNVYVAGETISSDFPGVGPESADNIFAGREGFVAKLSGDLRSILAATFFGGTGRTNPLALALDDTQNVYIAGFTGASDLPGISMQSADNIAVGDGNSFEEGFVAKLNSNLSKILAATFLGGSGSDEIVSALARDGTGNVYAAGFTDSVDFPGIGPNSADRIVTANGREGFVAKLNADLSFILAATFLGGSSGGQPGALALDSRGNVYVAGVTGSADFPGIGVGSANNVFTGGSGFVAKLNSELSTILISTFLGGGAGGGTSAGSLVLDTSGDVYVSGQTNGLVSVGVTPGAADRTFAGVNEGFVAKLDANLSGPEEIVNDKVDFLVENTSLNTSPFPGFPAGVFTIIVRLTNTSTKDILEPIKAIVHTLTNGNRLLSATEQIPKQTIDAGADNVLTPNESVTVQFRIGLANLERFDFFVDLSGIVNAAP